MVYVSVQIDTYTIAQLHEEIAKLRDRFGPERSVGPVTFEFNEDGEFRIVIETQKQGDMAYTINDIGDLVEES